ncbi:hypothetical protein KP509_20G082600 [Ceratopteris richardii]|uniref:Uncharacterized protein n=1 Tax=Ceratopteris richardii TaxID=49495 RepID=A0A8T2SKC4_CERRI|nr:hypothetical protein KP509_20G082600 [Ceratopteris richardii]KAH7332334.1 hypothetical protein KP509_20G082600 [Ceratopteris richardii]
MVPAPTNTYDSMRVLFNNINLAQSLQMSDAVITCKLGEVPPWVQHALLPKLPDDVLDGQQITPSILCRYYLYIDDIIIVSAYSSDQLFEQFEPPFCDNRSQQRCLHPNREALDLYNLVLSPMQVLAWLFEGTTNFLLHALDILCSLLISYLVLHMRSMFPFQVCDPGGINHDYLLTSLHSTSHPLHIHLRGRESTYKLI